MKHLYTSLLTCLLVVALATSSSAVTYTAKAGAWSSNIWLSSATNTYVSLSSVTLLANDQLIVNPGVNKTVTITGNIVITPKIAITVTSGTLFFERPVKLTLSNLTSTLTLNAGAYTDSDDSGNNILLTFGTNSDYNGKDFRGQGNNPRSGPFVFAESGNDAGGLPVTLVSFKAAVEEENSLVKLVWITTTEKNNAYFTIERSKDGENFEEVAKVQGSGTTSQLHTYNAIDPAPLAGTSYYRLRQTDLDGRNETFKLVSVKNSSATAFSLFPNPATSEGFSVRVSEDTQEATLLIYSHTGELILDQRIQNQGSASLRIDHALSAGLYWVKFVQEGRISVQKLVVDNH